ncbi:MAG TPA: BTAD domain-containing putative transcriptional regulator [Candidatus Baltobacteraceae bacterium]|nr:BTAD domain-containing putative transcriptional regulator [Candidatus Baltobacteraceae bacterium]
MSATTPRETRSLQITLLGNQRTAIDNARVESRLSSRAFLVLAALAVRGGDAINREELAFTLWPDLSENEARATLRRQLYVIDQALGAGERSVFARKARIVSWAEHLEVFVDASEFNRLCGREDGLEEAAALYGGDFAPYLDHEWVLSVRDRLRRQMCGVLDRLIAQSRIRNDVHRRQHYIERLLSVDPWREDAVRELMILRYLCGDRAGALRYYQAFAANLRAEFGVEPMPETAKCFQSIFNGSQLCQTAEAAG